MPATSPNDRESDVEPEGRDDRSAGLDSSPTQMQEDGPVRPAVEQADFKASGC
ncbi:hypothetical protein [Paludisphaera borealis]|uniref:hypothetical protein n=1 Tax=Paludisphaera borealis TaxID=1387353 RepID=UPI00143D2A70|nr:hypothetical protein [Paludisphaera borealis]